MGDLGQEAYHFVKFLYDSGVSVWQVLPLGMTHADNSPYQCLSAHAGNPALINIDWLVDRGWLQRSEKKGEYFGNCSKKRLIAEAFDGFLERAEQHDKDGFAYFCQTKAFWLDDFSLFVALRNEFNQLCWNQWPEHFKQKDANAIKEARRRLKVEIECIKFEQYVFFRQWFDLKAYANQHGVFLFGDIPIFVSYDSSDVWANREVFKLDESGEMSVVTGVPPDYFSPTGQIWGNPTHNWQYLEETDFIVVERMQTQLNV
jgi:4-alpha-glucanotransferase